MNKPPYVQSDSSPVWVPLFGVYALTVFLALALPTLLLLLLLPHAALRSKLARFSSRWLLRLTAISVVVEYPQNMPRGACVVVANHASYLDGILLKAMLPSHFRFVIKKEMSRLPLAGLFLRRIGSCFVDRENRHSGGMDMRKLLRAAAQGDSLGFFPEGTFKPEPGLGRFHTGAFVVAARAGLPVVPLCIRGTRRAFPPGSPWLRPGRVTITLLPVITAATDGAYQAAHMAGCAATSIADPLPAHAHTPLTTGSDVHPTTRKATHQATAARLRDAARAGIFQVLEEPDAG